LDTGIVVFRAIGFGPLWQLCRELGLSVVADVHTHPGVARQSDADRRHPMIATAGHIAVIVPNYAKSAAGPPALGLYEYEGEHEWRDYSGHQERNYFYIGSWG
jgi:proteasome lid subunit RPN8/RPN11